MRSRMRAPKLRSVSSWRPAGLSVRFSAGISDRRGTAVAREPPDSLPQEPAADNLRIACFEVYSRCAKLSDASEFQSQIRRAGLSGRPAESCRIFRAAVAPGPGRRARRENGEPKIRQAAL